MSEKKMNLDKKPIRIDLKDLPLCCPRPGVPVWNMHPKVYLPLEETRDEHCPYCDAHYILA